MRRAGVSLALIAVGVGLASIFALSGCGRGGKERQVVAAFQAFRQALAAEDAEGLKRTLTAARAATVDAEASPELLALAASVAPENPTVRSVTIRGDSATISLDAETEGQAATGIATLAREGGEWKVVGEEWKVVFGGSGGLGNFAGRLLQGPEAKPASRLSWDAHYGGVTRLAFLPDGERIVSIGINDRRLRVWNRENGSLLAEAELPARPSDMAVLSRSGDVAVVDADGQVTVWPLVGSGFGKPRRLSGSAGPTGRVAASPDGSLLATTGYSVPVRLWSPEKGEEVKELSGSTTMRGIAFSPRGLSLAAGGYGNTLKLWELDPEDLSGRGREIEIPKVAEQSDAWSVAWSPDGTLVLTGHMDSSITLWRVENRKEVHNFYVPEAAVMSVSFAPDGTVFVSGHNDGSIHYWETESATRLARVSAHQGPVHCLAFSPSEGELLASGGDDGRIVLWQ